MKIWALCELIGMSGDALEKVLEHYMLHIAASANILQTLRQVSRVLIVLKKVLYISLSMHKKMLVYYELDEKIVDFLG